MSDYYHLLCLLDEEVKNKSCVDVINSMELLSKKEFDHLWKQDDQYKLTTGDSKNNKYWKTFFLGYVEGPLLPNIVVATKISSHYASGWRASNTKFSQKRQVSIYEKKEKGLNLEIVVREQIYAPKGARLKLGEKCWGVVQYMLIHLNSNVVMEEGKEVYDVSGNFIGYVLQKYQENEKYVSIIKSTVDGGGVGRCGVVGNVTYQNTVVYVDNSSVIISVEVKEVHLFVLKEKKFDTACLTTLNLSASGQIIDSNDGVLVFEVESGALQPNVNITTQTSDTFRIEKMTMYTYRNCAHLFYPLSKNFDFISLERKNCPHKKETISHALQELLPTSYDSFKNNLSNSNITLDCDYENELILLRRGSFLTGPNKSTIGNIKHNMRTHMWSFLMLRKFRYRPMFREKRGKMMRNIVEAMQRRFISPGIMSKAFHELFQETYGKVYDIEEVTRNYQLVPYNDVFTFQLSQSSNKIDLMTRRLEEYKRNWLQVGLNIHTNIRVEDLITNDYIPVSTGKKMVHLPLIQFSQKEDESMLKKIKSATIEYVKDLNAKIIVQVPAANLRIETIETNTFESPFELNKKVRAAVQKVVFFPAPYYIMVDNKKRERSTGGKKMKKKVQKKRKKNSSI